MDCQRRKLMPTTLFVYSKDVNHLRDMEKETLEATESLPLLEQQLKKLQERMSIEDDELEKLRVIVKGVTSAPKYSQAAISCEL